MGNSYLSIMAAVAAACTGCLLSSCNGEFSSTTYNSEDSFPAAEGSEYALEVRISAEYPVSGLQKAALDNMDNVLTAALFGEEYAALDPEQAIEAYKADRAKEYRETNAPLIKESGEMPAASLDWSDCVTGTVGGCHKNVLSYSITKFSCCQLFERHFFKKVRGGEQLSPDQKKGRQTPPRALSAKDL